jgi:hypothetical protein
MSYPTCEMKFDGKDVFVIIDGAPIAKRGHPGTRNAKRWIPLVHGYRVRDTRTGIVVEFDGGDEH